MIESYYWKEDLILLEKELRPKIKPRNYSEKYHVNLEKRIIICFFIIRRLLELKGKLTKNIYKYKSELISYPAKSGSHITKLNDFSFEKHYDHSRPTKVSKDLFFISNQFIHHEIILLLRDETRNYSTVQLCSDYAQDKCYYEMTVDSIRKIFLLVGNDFVSCLNASYNVIKKDYDITCE